MKLTLASTDDDAASVIQWHLDRARQRDLRGQRIEVEVVGPSLPLAAGLVVDPWHATLDFGGAEVWYWPTTGIAIQQLSRKANCFTQLAGGVNNINLRTAGGSNAVAFDLRGDSANTRTSCLLQRLTAQGFAVGLQFADYAYLTFIHGLILDKCSTGLRWLAGADSGENVTITGGAITNGGLALDIQAAAASLNLVGVSLDYNQRVARVVGSGARVSLVAGHIEFAGTGAAAGQIVVNGNSSRFGMVEGDFLVSDRGGAGPYGFTNMVDVQHANSTADFSGVRLHNHRNITDTWAIGPGRVTVDGPTYEQALMPRRGHASQSHLPSIAGLVFREQIPNTLQVSTAGTRTLIKRGNVGAGNVQVGGIPVQVTALRERRLSLALTLEAQLDANAGISIHWADAGRTQLAIGNAWVGNPTPQAGGPAIVSVAVTSDLRVPSWATSMLVVVDISGGTAGKWIAVDNLEVGVW